MKVKVLENLMQANDAFARRIHQFRAERALPMLNIIGGAGCGKTTLLEALIHRLDGRLEIAVIEGDIATPRDAERMAATGVQSIQINTGGTCHLDAHLVLGALESLELDAIDLVIVENVGNMVCPAEFDIGEDAKIAVLSVAEGDDKPSKYPLLFRTASSVIVTKTDLAPHCAFDTERARAHLGTLNPEASIYELSALSGDGVDTWVDWIEQFTRDQSRLLRSLSAPVGAT